YRVQAIFMSGYRPSQWVPQVQRRLQEATQAQEKEAQEHNAKVDAAVARVKKETAELNQQYGERHFQDRLAKLPEAIRDDVKAALATEPGKRNEVQKYLAVKFQNELRPPPPQLAKLLAESYPDFKTRSQQLADALRVEEAHRR